MRRKSFDAMASVGGLVIAVVLLTASGLLFWAHDFIDDNVRAQLTAQHIVFPQAGSDALEDLAVRPYLIKYAGQQLVDGAQAKAYADHFIAPHLAAATDGRTYAELTRAAQQDPSDAELAALVQTSFRGETLRGLLLSAYAFWKIGEVALVAAWAALGTGTVLLVLVGIGFWRLRRTDYEIDVDIPRWHLESSSNG